MPQEQRAGQTFHTGPSLELLKQADLLAQVEPVESDGQVAGARLQLRLRHDHRLFFGHDVNLPAGNTSEKS